MANEASALSASEQAMPAGAARDAGAREFQVSDRQRSYVIWLLFSVYVLNFVDRQILTTLIQPIKEEFKFSDTQMGLLGGLAFAFLYTTLGIPIARWADRTSRVKIISLSLLVWSLFTALTGLAQSFTHFFLARVAVGVGEAGCSPSAYSLISDYFTPEKRSTALSIYSMGIYGGAFLGFLVGGQVAHTFGWRATFWVVGVPGVVLSVIVRHTLREPPRGFSDPPGAVRESVPAMQVLRELWAKRSFRHTSFAAALHAFVGYGVGGFYTAFLMRSHHMSLVEVSRWLALITVLGGFVGTYYGGWLADRLTNRSNDPRYQLLVPGVSVLLTVPVALTVYTLSMKYAVLALMIPTGAMGAMYLGPTFAVTQSLVSPRERALAGAIMLFIINLIGLGFGPLLTGMFSDAFNAHFAGQGMSKDLASAQGLRWALCAMTVVNVWSALHYMLGSRSLRNDMALAAAARAVPA
jgi:MFS family permease